MSNYSNLKIELMIPGTEDGTWGNVTNTNLGTALEEAIVGSADVAFSNANVTLTLTNTNASQPARNMRLNLTGSATSGYNLVVPSIEKPYIINNGTDGTITVKNTTGTGVAVPAGKTMWVYNNATNVVDATTHLSSLTLGAPLPIASGGTGGNTAANARTALGLGPLATASTVNLASEVSDVLPIANGGTAGNTAATARTGLGATVVGGSFFTLTDPSAITFPQINANNTVSALSAADFRTAIGAGSGAGSVTSVNGAGGTTGLTLTGGPITSSGTLTLGGTLAVANGGTGSTTAATAATALGLGTASNVQFRSIGVNTAASSTAGEIRATNNITAFYSSDARFKERIEDIENALEAVCAIGGKTFDWTDDYIKAHGGEDGYFVRKRDFGLIAQDAMKIFPLSVRVRPDETLAVDYEKLVALAFQAIKELRAEVEALKK